MEIEHILLVGMLMPLIFIIPLASGYLIYDDVEYSGYVVDITFSGGGFGSPDMTNIYFSDGRIIQAINSNHLQLKTNCNATIVIRDSITLYDSIVSFKEG